MPPNSFGRPENKSDPIKRKDLVSITKLLGEGQLSETKMILGWLLNTRELTLSLPFEKHKVWTTQIKKFIKSKEASFKQLEQTLGRLGHCTTTIPYMKHFMSSGNPGTLIKLLVSQVMSLDGTELSSDGRSEVRG